ncbi:Hypothetical predicted protein [Podarcis lilfordi]|uniref:Uncharacterized protein n=1 Tax=Podarcis lilfordi TaxID=74358 RepID=A0AA35LIU7_9SAUR|nr:Hypothetical predicted protein [Podarcis lilfordi]
MELEAKTNDLTILVHNQGYDDVTVAVSARPIYKLLDGNVVFFWLQWLWSSIATTNVGPKAKKKVNTVTSWNMITHQLGSWGWRLYNITVRRKVDGYVATCTTPLDCTWIVEERGIHQEGAAERNYCKFESPANSED